MKLAIFGGTFDPIHRAHLVVAREAVRQFSLDRVLFVPAAHPPHKSAGLGASYGDRLRMVEIACQDEPLFAASDVEAGEGKSFSILTIEKLRRAAPADDLYFLIGADAFAEIHTWYRWRDVIGIVEFIVVTRPGHAYAMPPGARVHSLATVALPVSSSEVRDKLARGENPPELPPAVLQYIREHGLYSAGGAGTPPRRHHDQI